MPTYLFRDNDREGENKERSPSQKEKKLMRLGPHLFFIFIFNQRNKILLKLKKGSIEGEDERRK